MKPILPSLREKKRYIAYEVIVEKALKREAIVGAINQGLLRFLGELGCAKAGIIFVENKEKKGILKVNNSTVDQIKAGLSLIKDINGEKVIIKTTKVSGTLAKLRKGG